MDIMYFLKEVCLMYALNLFLRKKVCISCTTYLFLIFFLVSRPRYKLPVVSGSSIKNDKNDTDKAFSRTNIGILYTTNCIISAGLAQRKAVLPSFG